MMCIFFAQSEMAPGSIKCCTANARKSDHILGVCDEGHMQVYTWRVIRYFDTE
jgi:hypothetical protein